MSTPPAIPPTVKVSCKAPCMKADPPSRAATRGPSEPRNSRCTDRSATVPTISRLIVRAFDIEVAPWPTPAALPWATPSRGTGRTRNPTPPADTRKVAAFIAICRVRSQCRNEYAAAQRAHRVPDLEHRGRCAVGRHLAARWSGSHEQRAGQRKDEGAAAGKEELLYQQPGSRYVDAGPGQQRHRPGEDGLLNVERAQSPRQAAIGHRPPHNAKQNDRRYRAQQKRDGHVARSVRTAQQQPRHGNDMGDASGKGQHDDTGVDPVTSPQSGSVQLRSTVGR